MKRSYLTRAEVWAGRRIRQNGRDNDERGRNSDSSNFRRIWCKECKCDFNSGFITTAFTNCHIRSCCELLD